MTEECFCGGQFPHGQFPHNEKNWCMMDPELVIGQKCRTCEEVIFLPAVLKEGDTPSDCCPSPDPICYVKDCPNEAETAMISNSFDKHLFALCLSCAKHLSK